MKNFIILFISVSSWLSSQAQANFSLEGNISPFQQGQSCKLYRLVYDDYSNRPKLSEARVIQVNAQGHFKQNIPISEASVYYISYQKQEGMLIANPKDRLQVTIKAGKPIVIKGSEANRQVQGFYQKMQELDKQYIHDIRIEMGKLKIAQQKALQAAKDDLERQTLQKKFTKSSAKVMARLSKASKQFFAAMAQYLQTQPPSLALYVSFSYWQASNATYLRGSIEQLFQKMPHNSYVKQMRQKINRLIKLQLYKPAPEISLNNPQGESVKLSKVIAQSKNKYVLVDFWATWCAPCIVENQNLIALYDKYAKMGFEIYAVSFDRKKEAWLKYLDKYKPAWLQVFASEGFQSLTSLEYNLREFPHNLLLDSKGRIIAKNLFGNALKEKLALLFEQ
ncbi:MAG TPA: hypothetical protein DCS93_35550 [Microscillaceae bacterium]|nr:hypothetical protein [Microscillaceae bacterium]